MRFSIGLMLALSFGLTSVARAEGLPKCEVAHEFKQGKLGVMNLSTGQISTFVDKEAYASDMPGFARDSFLHITLGGKIYSSYYSGALLAPKAIDLEIRELVKLRICEDGRFSADPMPAVRLAQELLDRLEQAPAEEKREAAKVLRGLFAVKSDASTAHVPTLQFLGEALPNTKDGQ